MERDSKASRFFPRLYSVQSSTVHCTVCHCTLYSRYFAGIILALLFPASAIAKGPPASIWNYLESHCADCHDGADAEGQIDLYSLDFDLANRETARRWILIHDQIESGEMPPKKKKRPPVAATKQMLAALSKDLTTATLTRSKTVLRRLNRSEYQNTVRDLFKIDLKVEGLPEDTPTNGFDNVGEGLAVSAEAMQAYLSVADQVLNEVIGPKAQPKKILHKTNFLEQVDWRGNPQLASQYGKMFRKTPDGIVIFQSNYCPTNLVNFARLRPPAGTYRVQIKARAIQSKKPVTMRVYAGDTIVRRKERHLAGYFDIPSGEAWTTVDFTDRLVEPNGTFQPKCYGTRDTRKNADTYPEPGIEIGDIVIEGPLEKWPPPSRQHLLGSIDPEKGTVADAKAIIEKLLPQAFRRPIKEGEADLYIQLFEKALADADRSFLQALRVSLKMLLCSPEFLFLEEPAGDSLSAFALASRLSYFLWSAPPDAELQQLAASGELTKPAVLKAQTSRLLADKKASAFTKNFTGQWLDLREINFTEPDGALFPEFDELLRLSITKETEHFFNEMLTHNLSVLNFIKSDFTYLNERLAKHYQIDGVVGQAFRKVALPPQSVRGGLLTQASILKVTANGTNTSPVLRGDWVLTHLLGTPTSPPPDNVGSVEPDIRGTTTLREKLEQHRQAKECAGCHAKIDPIGFALEQFDPIGGLRTNYRTLSKTGKHPGIKQDPNTFNWIKYRYGLPVDSKGKMANGETFTTINEFKEILLKQPEVITRNLTRQLFTYALGREIGFSDRPAIEEIVANASQQNDGLRTLIHEIIQSRTFTTP